VVVDAAPLIASDGGGGGMSDVGSLMSLAAGLVAVVGSKTMVLARVCESRPGKRSSDQ
jgi:hypothetical protein